MSTRISTVILICVASGKISSVAILSLLFSRLLSPFATEIYVCRWFQAKRAIKRSSLRKGQRSWGKWRCLSHFSCQGIWSPRICIGGNREALGALNKPSSQHEVSTIHNLPITLCSWSSKKRSRGVPKVLMLLLVVTTERNEEVRAAWREQVR